MKTKSKTIWLCLSILAIFTMSCSLVTGAAATPQIAPASDSEAASTNPTALPEAKPTGPTPTPPADVYAPPFAQFPDIPVRIPDTYAGTDSYTLPVDLTQVKGMDTIQLTEKQNKMLSDNRVVTIR